MTEEAEAKPFSVLVEERWQFLLDLDDHTSPEEYPDMCLIKYGELQMAMLDAFEAGVIAATGSGLSALGARRKADTA